MDQKTHRLLGEGGDHAAVSEITASNCLDAVVTTGEYPAHGTQAARLLSLLLIGREIGPMEGLCELGIYRLADTKFQLCEAGWDVSKDLVARNNRFSETCRVASYYLRPEIIAVAGAEGQEFARREAELMAEMLSERRGLS